MSLKGFKFIGPKSWSRVFAAWQKREGTQSDWQEVARKKGFKSWRTWRWVWLENIGASHRRWYRYRIDDPSKIVSQFLVGPTQSWQKYFPKHERLTHTFADLVNTSWHARDKELKIKPIFGATEFIGVVRPDNKIVLIEGHHRAAAVALAQKLSKKITFKVKPTIALTHFKKSDLKLLRRMLARGSTKEPRDSTKESTGK